MAATVDRDVALVEAALDVAAARRRLTAHAERAALAATIDLVDAALDAELAPPDARRRLFPHERRAGTHFAGIQAELDDAADVVARRVVADRAAALDVIAADLDARVGADPNAAAARLLDLDANVAALPRIGELIDAAHVWHRARLEGLAEQAARRVRREAAAQGVPVDVDAPIVLPRETVDLLDAQARRLAQGPIVDLVRDLTDALTNRAVPGRTALAAPSALATGAAARVIAAAVRYARELGLRNATSYGNAGTNLAAGLGRNAGADTLPRPAAVYASELLDRNTCTPCSHVDGTEYASLEDSLEDYPTGRYRLCEGGPRCRGTRVFVWDTEAAPTSRDPGDRPPPPPPPGGPPPPAPRPAAPAPEPEPAEPERPAWLAQADELRAQIDPHAYNPKVIDDVGASIVRHRLDPGEELAEQERLITALGRLVETRAGELIDPAAQAAARQRIAAARDRVAAWETERDEIFGQMHNARNAARRRIIAEADDPGAATFIDDLELQSRDAEYRDAVRRLGEHTAGYERLRLEFVDAVQADREVIGQARLAALRELRPMGGVDLTFERAGRGQTITLAEEQARDLVREAADYYPAEWLERSNALPTKLRPVARDSRAFYRGGDGILQVPPPDATRARAVAVHELGHRMEHALPELGRLEMTHHYRRTRNDPLKQIEGYADREYYREDRYVERYTGKEYSDHLGAVLDGRASYWELFTTGVESVFSGSKYADGDPDLVDFVLGALAGL